MILGLFFTRGVSLQLWFRSGLFEREKIIYEEHLKSGYLQKVYWFTYGSEDVKLSEKLKNEGNLHHDIEILNMPKFFDIFKAGNWLYTLFLPFFYFSQLRKCDILKTNQIDGSWSAVLAKKMYQKPLFVRTGYLASKNSIQRNKKKGSGALFFSFVEFLAFSMCDKASVSSSHDYDYAKKNFKFNYTKLVIIPNFVDTRLFYNKNIVRRNDRILVVGRLTKEKNLLSLFDAFRNSHFGLDIYGDGEMEGNLKQYVVENKLDVDFKGIVQNSQLPDIYNVYKFYILPSLFEGMPKTLLEAMACGCVCLGTNVVGINEIIRDKYNGIILDGTDVKSIKSSLEKINSYDLKLISKNSEQYIEQNFSLDVVLREEKTILKSLYGLKC